MPYSDEDSQPEYDPPRGPFPWRTLLLVFALCFTLGPLLAFGLFALMAHFLFADLANGFGPGAGFGPVQAGRDGVARRRPTVEQQLAQVREAQPILEAIYQYREDVGVWPMSLDDLVPEYLPAKPRWEYKWFNTGGFILRSHNGLTATAFHQSPRTGASWALSGGDWEAAIPGVPEPTYHPRPADPDERVRRFQAEMLRRRRDHSHLCDHWYYRAWKLYEWERWDLAAEACRECMRDHPSYDRAFVLLALIEHRAGRGVEGENELRAYAEKRNDYVGYFLLSEFYFQSGRRNAALDALRAASRKPIPTAADNDDVAWRLWRGTLRAYDEDEFELVIALCDRWEAWRQGIVVTDFGRDVFLRMGARLRLGRLDQARQDLALVLKKKEGPNRYGEQIYDTDELMEAVQKGNTTYIFEPWARESSFRLYSLDPYYE